jgi:hypothetical protein
MTLAGTKNIAMLTRLVVATGTRITIPSLATTTVTNATKTMWNRIIAKVPTMDTIATEFPAKIPVFELWR